MTAIFDEIFVHGNLRSRRPQSARGYYVWRLARFDGGKDTTMPVVAMLETEGDPFRMQLDSIASAVAQQEFGTNMAAVHTWGRAFGLIQ